MASATSTTVFALSFASAFFLLTASAGGAETHVDCDKVMHELVNGKSAQEVARDLGISPSTVYDCENAKAATVRQGMPSGMPSMSVPAIVPSPR
jgi:Bacterial regulatory proteins, luxR family